MTNVLRIFAFEIDPSSKKVSPCETFSLGWYPIICMTRFECDNCGACCQGHLIVEADDFDVLREPRLIEADKHHCGKSVEVVVAEIQTEFKAVFLALGAPCPFLSPDKLCAIYPTRPNCCVGMQAGDEQCQDARAAAGLLPLEPLP
jgi:Fe-S-cluster containining protein